MRPVGDNRRRHIGHSKTAIRATDIGPVGFDILPIAAAFFCCKEVKIALVIVPVRQSHRAFGAIDLHIRQFRRPDLPTDHQIGHAAFFVFERAH